MSLFCGHIKKVMQKARFTLLCLLVGFVLSAQNSYVISWKVPVKSNDMKMVWFEGASAQTELLEIPSFCGEVFSEVRGDLFIANEVFVPLSLEEIEVLKDVDVPTEIALQSSFKKYGDAYVASYCFLPVRKNVKTGKIEKLLSFNINVKPATQIESTFKAAAFDDTTALATGTWYKVAVTSTGIYKITPQFLAECGFNISNLPSSQLRVFGNGQGMLSEVNDENPNPGLKEVAIYVNDGGDGIFNGNDYALFYARGPHTWQYSKSRNSYNHTYNIYSDQSFYFITLNNGAGKRIQPVGYVAGAANYTTTSFDDFQFIETDLYNLVGSGKEWFGDLFDFKLSYDYTLQFANIDLGDTAFFQTKAVARSTVSGTAMAYKVNGTAVANLTFTAVGSGSGNDYVTQDEDRLPFLPTNGTMQINATYKNSSNPSATAWLDYIEVQVRRNLNMTENSMLISDRRAFRAGGVAQFAIANAATNLQLWDVTNHLQPRAVAYNITGSTASFNAPSDSLRVFAAIKGSTFPAPTKIGTVANQNLHGLEDIDMVIVSHPNFLAQANQLADFHRTTQNLSVFVTTPEMIYNEFSSGMQDITATKLFLKSLYDKPSTKNIKYVLLFGDASYDYKNRVPNMTNFVPIYQSKSSYSLYSSFCTDDYIGYLDDGEGKNMSTEDLDVAIGRMPVKTVAEASNAIAKIFEYKTPKVTFDDWRNKVLLIADDVDESWEMDFVNYTDRLGRELDTTVPNLNVERVFIDSYVQEVQAGSQRYPDARQEVYRKVQSGNLVTSYLGHGGEVGWATERILQLADVTGWNNWQNMPLFSTITCEFTRVDDPYRVSAGEQLFLNPNGGAIALYSTLRPVFATPSTYNINRQLFQYLFYQQNGKYLTIGEVIQATKNNNTSGDRLRFALIGDPAMYLAIPEHRVLTDSINGVSAAAFNDTLKALSHVKISGHLEDVNNTLLSSFNGIILPTVYDKKVEKTTLVNDGEGQPIKYKTQENVIFKGRASVENGLFTFEFTVPLDISFVIGEGKISYYATDSVKDAAGYNTDILVGGLDLTAKPDDEGPLVRVFINDTNFVAGGLTDKDPISLALISDSSGINTVGSGIGHDILGILDGNTSAPYILNSYFESDLNSYQSGQVTFPFFDLPVGEHHLLVRAWDVNNNPGEGEITFIVDASVELALSRVLNYPNPFTTETHFQFEHNRAGESLEIEIHIFNQSGELVKKIKENVVSTGNRVNQITWDGRSDSGATLGSGLYVYRVQVKSAEDGSTAQDYSKLVFIK